ncbi:hypothetical protein J4573_47490 [Actinomadura barringtoniae]|uniref:Protein kinase domain-containing protein n=1 Tax=Actinomadura barringtoniae TaxID=1427535 RepID=A0A939PTJ3_9ACTN|nr:hypothetical protein [Actinomadura barringtoniae]MBO2454804.1 hypothetical protein [Actinomadura barringtoniae]
MEYGADAAEALAAAHAAGIVHRDVPPEQINGDTATDAYALGVTLFHLLTGRVLFPADTSMAIWRDPRTSTPPLAGAPPPATSAIHHRDQWLSAARVTTSPPM